MCRPLELAIPAAIVTPLVSTAGEGGGRPEVNNFEQVSSDGHQISLAGAWYSEVPCLEVGGSREEGCTVKSMHHG